MPHREFARVGNGVIDAAVGHGIEQPFRVGAGIFHPHQRGQAVARRPQSQRMRATGGNLQVGVADVGQRVRVHSTPAIDQMLVDGLISRPELDAKDAFARHLQGGGRKMGAARRERPVNFGVGTHGHDLEFHAQFVGESLRHFELGPLRDFVRSAIEGKRCNARDHAQFPERPDLVDQARQRLVAAKQDRRGKRQRKLDAAGPIFTDVQCAHNREPSRVH